MANKLLQMTLQQAAFWRAQQIVNGPRESERNGRASTAKLASILDTYSTRIRQAEEARRWCCQQDLLACGADLNEHQTWTRGSEDNHDDDTRRHSAMHQWST